MKRDMELIRKLLLHFEENLGLNDAIRNNEVNIDSYTRDEIDYNIKAMYKGGLIECTDLSSLRSYACAVLDITPLGHDLLSSIRNESVWGKVKEQIKPLGDVPFEVIKTVATAAALKFIGLQ